MNLAEVLIQRYEEKKAEVGNSAWMHISAILREVMGSHTQSYKGKEAGQSWRVSKGNALEDLLMHIVKDEVSKLGLQIISGKALTSKRLTGTLFILRTNILLDYPGCDPQLPDADLIIYDPSDNRILAILSVKSSLRERIAQTGYWKLKLFANQNTSHIKAFFVTLDEGNKLKVKKPTTKGRAISENDIDCTYVMSLDQLEESEHVKKFDKFLSDIAGLVRSSNSINLNQPSTQEAQKKSVRSRLDDTYRVWMTRTDLKCSSYIATLVTLPYPHGFSR